MSKNLLPRSNVDTSSGYSASLSGGLANPGTYGTTRSQSFASVTTTSSAPSAWSTPNRYRGASMFAGPVLRAIVLYRRRWLMLFSNFLLNTANSVVWVAVSSVQAPAALLYGVSEDSIVLLTNLVYAVFVPGTILSSYLLRRYGLYTTSATGALLLSVASWLRVFSAFKAIFPLEIVASIVFSLGQPLVMNGVAKFAYNWMPPSERFLSTMVYNTVPASLGAAILNLVAAKRVHRPEQLPAYLLLVAGSITAVSIFFLLTFRERPPTPPEYRAPQGMRRSSTARSTDDPNEEQQLRDEREAERLGVGRPCGAYCFATMRNGPFVCCLTLSTVTVLIICAYPASAYNVLHPLGYNQSHIDSLAAVFFVSGILGAVLVAPLADCLRLTAEDYDTMEAHYAQRHEDNATLDAEDEFGDADTSRRESGGEGQGRMCWSSFRLHSTKIFLIILMMLSTGSAALLFGAAKPDNFGAIAFAVGAMAFSINAVVPIALETGAATAQKTLSEANSSGIMIATGNIFGFVLVYIIEGTKSPSFALSLFLIINVIGLVAAASLCSRDRRMADNDRADAFVPKLFRTPANTPSRAPSQATPTYATLG